ncbi:MAG: response regulator [Planctomycetes bacterium]|nr:response regulator [Planctomycetota bacterium]
MNPEGTAPRTCVDLAAEILDRLVAELPIDNACLHLLSTDGQRLICQAVSSGFRATRLAYGLDIRASRGAFDAIATGRPIAVDDARHDPRVAELARRRYGLASCIYLPVTLATARRGLVVVSRQSPHTWSPAEIERARRTIESGCAELAASLRFAPTAHAPDSAWLRGMLDAVSGIVLAIDRSFSVLDASRELVAPRPGARSVSLHELIQRTERGPELRRALADVMQGELPAAELLLRAEDGSDWRVDVAPIIAEGHAEPVGASVCCTDVTEVRRAEELLAETRHLEALGRISATVSHEFRNVLQLVDSCLDPAGGRGEPVAADLAAARETISRGVTLARQLLAFARMEPADERPVDLGELTAARCALLRGAVGPDRRLELNTESATARVDADLFELALLNLLINARDATSPGGRIDVHVERGATADGAPLVVLRVRDDGCGMTPQIAARAGEPFFSTKPRGIGTGLGLATVRSFAERLGGAVRITSTPGEGTEVAVLLPALDEAVAPAESASAPVSEVARPARARRALVVEDEELIARWVARLLRRHGLEVEVAGSVDDALNALDAAGDAPDLVVLDLGLGDRSGVAVFRAAQERGLPARFVATSGYADDDDIQALTAGGARFLRKPFSGDELLAACDLLPG